jgi:hypothetical protein
MTSIFPLLWSPKELDDKPFLIFLEIAMDFWLEDYFAKAQQDPEVEDFVQTYTPIIDVVHVTSEYPTYDRQVGDLVALVSANQDPFWLARVKKIKENSLSMTYYHHGPQISGKTLVWKAHNSKGTCGKFDVYVYFRFNTEEQLFTKGKTILRQALKKIAQACLIYNGLEVPETFK